MPLVSEYEYKLNIPKFDLTSPSSWGSREAIAGQVRKIMQKYGSYIKWSADNSKVPMEVIAGFIAVESGGNASAGSSGHVTQGLMQWNRDYIYASLEAESKLGRMTPAEKDKLKSFGITFSADHKINRKITNADQLKPELNILIGTILLGQYVDSMHDGGKKTISNGSQVLWAKDDDGELRMDRIIAVYNGGAYGEGGTKARSKKYPTAKALADAVNSVTSSYIKKVMGKNGALDVATSDAKSEFAKYRG
jgi:hypothetical protein